MRPVVTCLVLLAALLAGCAGPSAKGSGPTGNGSGGPASLAPGTGLVHGVVVDTAIRPVAGAAVSLTGGAVNQNKTTAKDGAFLFDSIAPGTYILTVHHAIYREARTTVQVVAGERDPPQTKIQVERLFTQDAFHETLKFDGFLQCAWAVEGVASSTCVNDLTHFVGLGYTCPQCEHLFDNRGENYPLGGGWQTQVYEVVWDVSAQGTSPEMRLTISHFPRPASHWYCSGTGASPIYLRIELGKVCADQQSDPKLIPPEGEQNMTMFMAAKAPSGQPAAASFSQKFSVYMNFFYFGKPSADWSFVKGDPYPF